MAVKMRLMRTGKKKSAHYRVVVIDGRAPRDGRYIDQIGRYDPRAEPSVIEIDADKAVDWLRKGAQPTEAVAKLLDAAGALTEFKVKSGRIHTVGGSAPQEAPEPAAEEAEEAPAAAEAETEESPLAEAEESAEEEPTAESEEEPTATEEAEEASEKE